MPKTICSGRGCRKPVLARGLCGAHYQRWYRQAHPERVVNRQRKEYSQRYYQEHRDEILARQKEREAADPEAYRRRKREAARRWREENPEKAREKARRHWARKKYGLSLEEYEAILAQGCAICGAQEDPDRENRRQGRLCLDHDHTSGKIRAALCKDCNVGIGSLGDDPARLKAAATYLEKHR